MHISTCSWCSCTLVFRSFVPLIHQCCIRSTVRRRSEGVVFQFEQYLLQGRWDRYEHWTMTLASVGCTKDTFLFVLYRLHHHRSYKHQHHHSKLQNDTFLQLQPLLDLSTARNALDEQPERRRQQQPKKRRRRQRRVMPPIAAAVSFDLPSHTAWKYT